MPETIMDKYTSAQVYSFFREIETERSRNRKIELMEKIIDDKLVRSILLAAMNPYITYGITPDPVVKVGEYNYSVATVPVFTLLNDLAERKIVGNAARSAVNNMMAQLNPESAALTFDILGKNLRLGMSAKTINKIRPGLIPSFEMMAAKVYEPDRIKKWPQIIEPKYDGYRTACFVHRDNTRYMSRTGHEFTGIESLHSLIHDVVHRAIQAAQKLPDTDSRKTFILAALTDKVVEPIAFGAKAVFVPSVMLDGELLGVDFSDTGAVKSKKGSANIKFVIFDVVPLKQFSSSEPVWEMPYKTRRMVLEFIAEHSKTARIQITERYITTDEDDALNYYTKFRARGLEGAMLKDPDGFYYKKRTHDWMKLKNEESAEFKVKSVVEGTGKYVGMLGAFIIDVNGVDVNVGSGLSDHERVEYWKNPPLGAMIEVEFQEYTPDGSLRHPRFVKLRHNYDLVAAA